MLQIRIVYPNAAPAADRASVTLSGDPLPEYGQVWIWDMFYAQTAHALAGTPALEALREDLELWGVNMSSKIFQPFEHIRSKGHLNLRADFELVEAANTHGPSLELEVLARPKEMPQVRMRAGEDLEPQQRAGAVIALGQYFINQNELFAKELPLHVLAFRKFYADVAPPEASSSVEDAPMFAIQKALEYFNSVAHNGAH